MQKVLLSHSSMQDFLGCPRKYLLRYIHGLTKPYTSESKALVIGSAFHEGMEAAARHYVQLMESEELELFEPEELHQKLINAAVLGAEVWIRENQRQNVPVIVTSYGEQEDPAYAQMWIETRELVRDMFRFYIPEIGLGTRYIPLSSELIEYEFEWDFYYDEVTDTMVTLTGKIDLVAYDKEDDVIVALDWKTRASMPADYLVEIDMQLPLYALALRENGVDVHMVRQVQFLKHTPNRPKFKKDGAPSMAQQATTWTAWSEGLRERGIDPEPYKSRIIDKLRSPEDYVSTVSTLITEDVFEEVESVVVARARQMLTAFVEENYPARLSSNGCRFCPFSAVCRAKLVGNADEANNIIEKFFVVDPSVVRMGESED
jgi:RecB family exonuclease